MLAPNWSSMVAENAWLPPTVNETKPGLTWMPLATWVTRAFKELVVVNPWGSVTDAMIW